MADSIKRCTTAAIRLLKYKSGEKLHNAGLTKVRAPDSFKSVYIAAVFMIYLLMKLLWLKTFHTVITGIILI